MTDPVTTNVRHHDREIETLWTGATVTHRFVEASGLRWHAATAGDPTNPDVVVFLHGFPDSTRITTTPRRRESCPPFSTHSASTGATWLRMTAAQ